MGTCKLNEEDLKIYELKIKGCEIIKLDPSIAIVSKSICRIETSDGSVSSGFLIKFFKGEENFFCLMTNQHVITKDMIKKKDTISFCYDNNNIKIKIICLNTNERYIKNFQDENFGIDATVIEILPEDNIPTDYFLLPDIYYMTKFNELKDKDIAILQYPNGKLGYSYGKIKEIHKYEFSHLASTESGSSGSPIFLKSKIQVIGIHYAGKLDNSQNYGFFIGPIYNYFKNFSKNNPIFEEDKTEESNIIQKENILDICKEETIENDVGNKNSNARLPSYFLKVAKSYCLINSKSIGFLVSLPVYMGDTYSFSLYGLLTTNSILSEEEIKPGKELQLYFYESKKLIHHIIRKNSFVFSCPFIDVSFVEIPFNTIKNVEYLRTCKECTEGQEIFFIKSHIEDDLFLINGNIKYFYGTDIRYKIDENCNSYPSPGSAVISLSKQSDAEIIGICKENSLDSEKKYKRATHISIIINAINSLLNHNISSPLDTLSPAKKLSYSEIILLEKEGLITTKNPDLFISPRTFLLITSLYFYRTQYAWFWTPKEPKDYNLEEIKKCNWSLIGANRPITVIGGFYNNQEPAPRNIKLIQFLIDSDLSFLNSKEV